MAERSGLSGRPGVGPGRAGAIAWAPSVLGLPRDRDPYADRPFEERPHG